ncbi:hypothetical protein VTH82DRAFT_8286 [Thermothelomyces myriococcoides]
MSSYGDVNERPADNLTEQHGSAAPKSGQLPHLHSSDEPRWAPAVTAADVPVDLESNRDDDSLSIATSTSSTTSGTYITRSSNASRVSQMTHITTPSNGPPASVVGLVPPVIGASGVVRPDQILWCEFGVLLGCDQDFSLDDEAGWISHHVQHLNDKYPQKLVCWFCDDVPFKVSNPAEAYANFVARMNHIRDHILDDHRYTSDSVRPDFNLVHQLYKNGTLDEFTYRKAMSYSELPPEYRLPGDHSESSPSSPRDPGSEHPMLARA